VYAPAACLLKSSSAAENTEIRRALPAARGAAYSAIRDRAASAGWKCSTAARITQTG
jgi:hypothetical protein